MVLAADESELIGASGGLPWHISEDMKRFRRLTEGHVVVVGRKTQDSIVARLGHPLPGRTTVVVTRTAQPDEASVRYRTSITSALATARELEPEEVFVIGGTEIYRQAMPEVTHIHLTRVRGTHSGDTYMFAGWLDGFTRADRDERDGYAYETWIRD